MADPKPWPVDPVRARTHGPPEGREPRPDQYEAPPDQQADKGAPQIETNRDQQAGTARTQQAPDQGGSGQSSEGIA